MGKSGKNFTKQPGGGSYILGINSYNERESKYKLTFNTPEATLEPLKDDAYEPNNSEESEKVTCIGWKSLFE